MIAFNYIFDAKNFVGSQNLLDSYELFFEEVKEIIIAVTIIVIKVLN